MDASWISEYKTTTANAIKQEWFVSPLEYSWSSGKELADQAYRAGAAPSSVFDDMLSPTLYKTSMQFDFRAKMMVCAFMRENVAKTYGLEIESGLMSLFGLDFLSCLLQWLPVVEGYTRQLFQVQTPSNVRPTGWTIPATGDALRDSAIQAVSNALAEYYNTIMYRSANDPQTTTLSRHLVLHGNLQNNLFYSQKNCLAVMFVLDALVFIEMLMSGTFPQMFDDQPGDADRIARRNFVYAYEMKHSMSDAYLVKRELLDEHV
ncbi:hypothetical protein GR223_23475 [Rhizobium leguminosarum]|uniref:hypothetical protein n=1 Tax=Rhizobium ruizarguesonis TaxID=2081791 RepID=UPI0013DE86FA|nr:hypothetical protein [Rhizobium ruizarguesonis]NEJ88857.1 hypothetical protein [Rhizobium ruizarguesonis]